MKFHFLFLLAFFIPVISGNTIVDELGTPSREGTDYALFFSVTDFDDWPDFPASSAQEVRAIEQELKMEYGFQTEFIANPSKQRILSVLGQYAKRRYQPQDQLLIYFSMHGQYDKAMGAIIPKDGKEDDFSYESWITHPTLEALISRIPCQHIILSLDACYSGTFGEKYRGRPDAPAWEVGEDCESRTANALKYKSRLYLTSGGVERTPTQSQFAKKWLEALRGRNVDGLLGFHELYDVLKEANPRPRFGDFRGHAPSGDFVFVHNNACRPQQDRQALDQNHWRSLGKTPSRTALEQHLKEYPACPHFQQAIDLLTTINRRKSIPDDMVFIQGGTFEMGDIFGDGEEDEKPTHKVTLGDYYLGRYEVTVAEFSEFILATNYKTDAEKDGGSYFWKNDKWEKKAGIDWRYDAAGKKRPNSEYNHPVIHVSWNDALAYCNWRSEQEGLRPVYKIIGNAVTPNWLANGYRLPTEAEWEYAARSRGKKYKYSWGNGSPSGNIADEKAKEKFSAWGIWEDYNDGYVYTSPVGAFKPNDSGLFDMTGNVWEWCWDWYGDYSNSTQTNPRGPSTAKYRVLRGGSWSSRPAGLRCANRDRYTPGSRYDNVGFRLSRAAP